METTWILGYIFAAILVWIGLSKRVGNLRPSSRQVMVAAGLLLFLGMIGLSLDKAFGWWAKFPKEIIGALGVLIILDRFGRIALLPGRGGAVVLDLGRIGSLEVILNILVALALSWYVLKNMSEITQTPGWKLEDIAYQIFGLSVAVAVLVQGVAKRKFLEQGVFLGTSFVQWQKVEGFGWEKESGTSATLVLYKRTPIPFFNTVNISVRLEQMKPIEDILQQHNIPRRAESPKLEL